MALREASYEIAARGFATSFTESELPPQYCAAMRNRFINAAGGAEKRQGISQLGDTISGTPNLDAAHELVEKDGTATLLVSGEGKIWKYDGSSAYSQVRSGLDPSSRLQSVQMGSKLIFTNGHRDNRVFFTEDGSTFEDLVPIIELGTITSASTTTLTDVDVVNWTASAVGVAVNDLVHNQTREGYGIITAVTTATITFTAIGTGATGIGTTSADPANGDRYRILDLVELNIIPTAGDDDNVATAGASTSATGVYVSAVSNWLDTDVRVGDYVRNTTRTAVAQVTAVTTAALRVTGIAGQTTGDALVFMKSALPIATQLHVRSGRLYAIDERDRTKIRVSGPDDPTDFTNGATIDSSTFSFGNQTAAGDIALAMGSYQRFFAVAGYKNILLFEGSDPTSSDFALRGLFPQGIVSRYGVASIGNDIAFVTHDGLQTVSMVADASTLGRANISEAIKTTLREKLDDASESQIQLFHYPQRSWLVLKIGSELFVFNYTPFFGKTGEVLNPGAGTIQTNEGSWSLFDGKFARQSAFLVRQNDHLVCVGDGGKVYQFDQGSYSDDGEAFTTEYQTGFLTLNEPKKSVRIKDGKYFKPILLSSDISYTVTVDGGFEGESSETITVSTSGNTVPIGSAVIGTAQIGGTGIQNVKYPLRWRGEVARVQFTTSDANGPDTIARFTFYHTVHGKR